MSYMRRPVIINYEGKETEGYLIHLGSAGSATTGLHTEAIIELYNKNIITINSSDLVRFNDFEKKSTLTTPLLLKQDLEYLRLTESGILNLNDSIKGILVYERQNNIDKPVGRVISSVYNSASGCIVGDIEFTDCVDMTGKDFSVRAKRSNDTFYISCINIVEKASSENVTKGGK